MLVRIRLQTVVFASTKLHSREGSHTIVAVEAPPSRNPGMQPSSTPEQPLSRWPTLKFPPVRLMAHSEAKYERTRGCEYPGLYNLVVHPVAHFASSRRGFTSTRRNAHEIRCGARTGSHECGRIASG